MSRGTGRAHGTCTGNVLLALLLVLCLLGICVGLVLLLLLGSESSELVHQAPRLLQGFEWGYFLVKG